MKIAFSNAGKAASLKVALETAGVLASLATERSGSALVYLVEIDDPDMDRAGYIIGPFQKANANPASQADSKNLSV